MKVGKASHHTIRCVRKLKSYSKSLIAHRKPALIMGIGNLKKSFQIGANI